MKRKVHRMIFFIIFEYIHTSNHFLRDSTINSEIRFINPSFDGNNPLNSSVINTSLERDYRYLRKVDSLSKVIKNIHKLKGNTHKNQMLHSVRNIPNDQTESNSLPNTCSQRCNKPNSHLSVKISFENSTTNNSIGKCSMQKKSSSDNDPQSNGLNDDPETTKKSEDLTPQEIYATFFDVESGLSNENIIKSINETIKILESPLKFMRLEELALNNVINGNVPENLMIYDDKEYIINLFYKIDADYFRENNPSNSFESIELETIRLNSLLSDEKSISTDSFNHKNENISYESISKNIILRKEYLALTFLVPESIYIFTHFLNNENIQNYIKKGDGRKYPKLILENYKIFKKKYLECLIIISNQLDAFEKFTVSGFLFQSPIFLFEILFKYKSRKKDLLFSKINSIREYLHHLFDYFMNTPPRYPHYDDFQKITNKQLIRYGLNKHLNHFARYSKTYTPFPIETLEAKLKIISSFEDNLDSPETIRQKRDEIEKKLKRTTYRTYFNQEIMDEFIKFLILFEKDILKWQQDQKTNPEHEYCGQIDNKSHSCAKMTNYNKIMNIKYKIFCTRNLNLYFVYLNSLVLKRFFQ